MNFILHPNLAADTIPVCELPLCKLLLMNNANFPWLILVPRRMRSSSEAVAHNYIKELFDLTPDDYQQTMQEVRTVADKFSDYTKADKMNVAVLGNIVPQLHIHIIARFKTDAAWPNPVWNNIAPKLKYSEPTILSTICNIKKILNNDTIII